MATSASFNNISENNKQMQRFNIREGLPVFNELNEFCQLSARFQISESTGVEVCSTSKSQRPACSGRPPIES
ncbi:hypothetical protein J6590_049165 [Homalodisca vitripennis]|nr:hypothetical protein J6590_049165 [Homalodisca vitripennis]